ncbi:MAG TPA: hypothetical protein VJH03_20130 [Blastocatellia bacterium]|nr:hypothetical protein [Blastocatellia bacterium]
MYCPVCGAESTQGLNYCKRCGASLGLPISAPEPKPAANFTRLTVALSLPSLVGALGLTGLFVTAAELGSRIDPRFLVATIAFEGATVVGVVLTLAWLLLRLSGLPQPAIRQREIISPAAMNDRPAELAPKPAVMPSVTEHTTRNFEPARNRDKPA